MASRSRIIVYPPDVEEISDDLNDQELVHRLVKCAECFQNMEKDDDNDMLIPLAIHLTQDSLIHHSNLYVRSLIASCVADVFRIFVPDPPYANVQQLKKIFLLFIEQLEDLKNPELFGLRFHMLAALVNVSAFSICIEIEPHGQNLICKLFDTMFTTVSDSSKRSNEIKPLFLRIMRTLLKESHDVSQELLDIILINIINPRKTNDTISYRLAEELLIVTGAVIKPYFEALFNDVMISGKKTGYLLATRVYELIYELYYVNSDIVLACIVQLELKLQSYDDRERLEAVQLLGRMFSDKGSTLVTKYKSLWYCYLKRFNDIDIQVRTMCIKSSSRLLVYHPEVKDEIAEQLCVQKVVNEVVDLATIKAISDAGQRGFTKINEELVNILIEFALHEKLTIKKKALQGLALIYKRCITDPHIPDCLSQIKNTVLHNYCQNSMDMRFFIKHVLCKCLFPCKASSQEHSFNLYQFYATIDETAATAFQEILKHQTLVRCSVWEILELQNNKTDNWLEEIWDLIKKLTRIVPESKTAAADLNDFFEHAMPNESMHSYMGHLIELDAKRHDAIRNLRKALKCLDHLNVEKEDYTIVERLLEFIGLVLVDSSVVEQLIKLVWENVHQNHEVVIKKFGPLAVERGFKLLCILADNFSGSFRDSTIHESMMKFFELPNVESAAETALKVFGCLNLCEDVDDSIVLRLKPLLETYVLLGTINQAKPAVRCLYLLFADHREFIGHIYERLLQNLDHCGNNLCTILTSIGCMALHMPFECTGLQVKITRIVIKELLMSDRATERSMNNNSDWCSQDQLSELTRIKIECMKLLVRWLQGLKVAESQGVSTLKLLSSIVNNGGDLMKRQLISRQEMSWLRLKASCCILKLCRTPFYEKHLEPEMFAVLVSVVTDKCKPVREKFTYKLYKTLMMVNLPIRFMGLLAFGANEQDAELKQKLQRYLKSIIDVFTKFCNEKHVEKTGDNCNKFVPEHVFFYVIYLLAIQTKANQTTLRYIEKCLKFLKEAFSAECSAYLKFIFQKIKCSTNALNPDDKVLNAKIYAVCDQALELLPIVTKNFRLDFDFKLPEKLYKRKEKKKQDEKKSKRSRPEEKSSTENSGEKLEESLPSDLSQHMFTDDESDDQMSKRPRLEQV